MLVSFINCGSTVSHMLEGHTHETHGHKTTTTASKEEEHTGSKADKKGIFFSICRGNSFFFCS